MSELVTVYPSKPPVKGGYSNPGAILYRGVYFSVTLRSVAVKTDEGKDKVLIGTMKTAISMMDDIVEAHNAGLVVLNDEVLYREPEDQRPADESRKTYEAPDQEPPRQQSAGDGEGHDRIVNIKRIFNTDGTAAYEVTPLFKDKPSKYPYAVKSARDVASLESALKAAGLNPEQWKVNHSYALIIDVTWTWGGPIPNNNKGARYKDDMQFVVHKTS